MSSSSKSGFTLIEMLVVVAIFTIMTGILLANLPEFRDRSSLELLAQQLAINVRTAQVYGIGTKATEVADPNSNPTQRFEVWYGIHFDQPTGDPTQPGLKEFVLFADKNQNGAYDEAEGEKELTYYISGARYGVTSICSYKGDVERCGLNGVNIVYRRPYTEAAFYSEQSGWRDDDKISVIISALGRKEAKEISIWRNGQIAVESGLYPGDPYKI